MHAQSFKHKLFDAGNASRRTPFPGHHRQIRSDCLLFWYVNTIMFVYRNWPIARALATPHICQKVHILISRFLLPWDKYFTIPFSHWTRGPMILTFCLMTAVDIKFERLRAGILQGAPNDLKLTSANLTWKVSYIYIFLTLCMSPKFSPVSLYD